MAPPPEVEAIHRELLRVTRPQGRIVFGSIPDRCRRDEFLGPYLEGVRTATHLSVEQKAAILTRNRKSHWFDADELAGWWRDRGATATRHPLSQGDPDRNHRFHLVVSVPSNPSCC
jgi:hypothetical protein